MKHTAPRPTTPVGRRGGFDAALARALFLLGFGLLAVVFSKLSLPAAILTFIGWLALPKRPSPNHRWQKLALGLATAAACLGVMRFIVTEAVPGIVQGGSRATESRAISRLREVLFAQDMLRKNAFVDPDKDGIGSAGLLGELTSEQGLRGGRPLEPPLLERYPRLVQTRTGPAADIGGYFFLICLPISGGGFSAEPTAPIDEEWAERRFLAYAWPKAADLNLPQAFFLDEHERILIAPALGDHPRLGTSQSPRCEDAVSEPTRSDWKPWKQKKARSTLPWDRH